MRDKIAFLERRRDGIREWLEDEAPHAAAVAQHLGTDHTELHLSPAAARGAGVKQ